MSDKPFLKEATRLHILLGELTQEEVKIHEIEIYLARTFTDGYQEGWTERENEGFQND